MATQTTVNPRRLKGVCFGHLARFQPSTQEEAAERLSSVFGHKVEVDQRELWVREWWEKANPPAQSTPTAPESDYRTLVQARLLQVHLGARTLEDLSQVFTLVQELGGLENAKRALESLEYLQNIGASQQEPAKRDS